MASSTRRSIGALRVRQWMQGWDDVEFSSAEHRRKPEPHFYLFALPAVELRALCGISRRQANKVVARSADLGIQRAHDPERSQEINRFSEFGYPWSTLSEAKRESDEYNDLRKPGWLPTAIVINILKKGEKRSAGTLAPADEARIGGSPDSPRLELPYADWTPGWRPTGLPPFEVIDGQHRLWSFTDDSEVNFDLPVVAFHGLDISWQAYLFWTINIKPKRISASLAFDLYPLLRGEDWLERGEGHPVYRETRSQELVESLWSHRESPWYDRINMLGDRQSPWVSQAAWVRSLMATFIRPWAGRGKQVGGLFGSRISEDQEVLGWNRAQQAAFVILAWSLFRENVQKSSADWALRLRFGEEANEDSAFYGRYSLIPTDQGVRGFLHVLNDLFFRLAPKLDLRAWRDDATAEGVSETAVAVALKSLKKQEFFPVMKAFAKDLSDFDWRVSAAPGLDAELRRRKLVFRGSSGYKELRLQLLEHLSKSDGEIGTAASKLLLS